MYCIAQYFGTGKHWQNPSTRAYGWESFDELSKHSIAHYHIENFWRGKLWYSYGDDCKYANVFPANVSHYTRERATQNDLYTSS